MLEKLRRPKMRTALAYVYVVFVKRIDRLESGTCTKHDIHVLF